MSAAKFYFILTTTLIIISIFEIVIVSAGGCMKNSCTSFNGSSYALNSSQAILLTSSITPTVSQDPSPCCAACYKTDFCSLYDIKFNNGYDAVCSLYSLPKVLLDNSEYLKFILSGNGVQRSIGFSYKYTGIPIPPATTTVAPNSIVNPVKYIYFFFL
jgi:hypothetical protein